MTSTRKSTRKSTILSRLKSEIRERSRSRSASRSRSRSRSTRRSSRLRKKKASTKKKTSTKKSSSKKKKKTKTKTRRTTRQSTSSARIRSALLRSSQQLQYKKKTTNVTLGIRRSARVSNMDVTWETRMNKLLQFQRAAIAAESSAFTAGLGGPHDKESKVECVDRATRSVGEFIYMLSMIGSASVNGEAWRACVTTRPDVITTGKMCEASSDKEHIVIALKKMPIRTPIKNGRTLRTMIAPAAPLRPGAPVSARYTRGAFEHEVWVEMFCLDVARLMIEQKICPNVPLLYGFSYCENGCEYQNKELKGDSTSCLLVANELARGDIKTWLTAVKSRSELEWKCVIWDHLNEMTAMQEVIGIVHYDKHQGNTLFHGAPANVNGTFNGTYKRQKLLPDESYDRPVIDHTHTGWDYQFAYRKKLLDSLAWREYHEDKKEHGRSIWTRDYKQLLDPYQIAITLGAKLANNASDDAVTKALIKHKVPESIVDILFDIQDMADDKDFLYTPLEVMRVVFKDWRSKPDHVIVEEYDLTRPIQISSAMDRTGLFRNRIVVN